MQIFYVNGKVYKIQQIKATGYDHVKGNNAYLIALESGYSRIFYMHSFIYIHASFSGRAVLLFYAFASLHGISKCQTKNKTQTTTTNTHNQREPSHYYSCFNPKMNICDGKA